MSEFKTKGRKLSALELEILGPIEPQDLIAREEGGLPTSEAPTIAKLRGIHHEIAQLLAQGLRNRGQCDYLLFPFQNIHTQEGPLV